jgi:heat shock protein HslJ
MIAVAAMAAGLGACDESPTSPSELIGQSWRLVAIDRAGSSSLVPPGERRLALEFLDNGRLSVRADCNSCGGTFELTGARLTVRPLACTRAFCGNDSLDTPFLDALSNARTVHLEGSQLTIQAGNATLRFTRD